MSFEFNAPQRADLAEVEDVDSAASMPMEDLEAGLFVTNDHFFVQSNNQEQQHEQEEEDELDAYERGEMRVEDLIAPHPNSVKPNTGNKMRNSTNQPRQSIAPVLKNKRPIPVFEDAPQAPPAAAVQEEQVEMPRPSSPKMDPRVPPPAANNNASAARKSVLPTPASALKRPVPLPRASVAPMPRTTTAPLAQQARQPSPRTAATLAQPRQPSPRTTALAQPRQPSPRTAALAQPRPRTPPPPPATSTTATVKMLQRPQVQQTHGSAAQMLPVQHQYEPKTQAQVYGRSNTPGYLTPTEASKSSLRAKYTASPRPASPPPTQQQPRAATPTLTTPRTPQLMTRQLQMRRSASFDKHGGMVTSEELELERIAKEKEELRRRKEEDRQRVQRASLNPVRPPRALTEPKPFNLRVDARLGAKTLAPEPYKSALEISSQVLVRDAKCWIEPQCNPAALSADVKPFALASDTRLRGSTYKPTEEMEWERIQHETQEEQYLRELRDRQRFAAPISVSASAAAAAPKREPTQPMPFHLESLALHERAQQELEERIQREREAEAQRRNFHALPYEGAGSVTRHHSGSGASMSHRAPTPPPVLTNPKAPSFVGRAQALEEQRRARLEREKREREEAAIRFKARALPKTTYECGFVPAASGRPLVQPVEPQLKTQARSLGRSEFDSRRREHEEQEERARQAREEEAKAKELAELRIARKSLVHKPLPVPATSRFSHAGFTPASEEETGFGNTIPELDENDLHEPIARRLRSSIGLGGPNRVVAAAAGSNEAGSEQA